MRWNLRVEVHLTPLQPGGENNITSFWVVLEMGSGREKNIWRTLLVQVFSSVLGESQSTRCLQETHKLGMEVTALQLIDKHLKGVRSSGKLPKS